MLNTNNNKLYVQLASAFDISRLESFSKNQLVAEKSRPYGNCFYEVDDLKTAQILCTAFIKHFDLGASNWTGGLITNDTGNFVARISYNGRVWDNQDWKFSKEIEL